MQQIDMFFLHNFITTFVMSKETNNPFSTKNAHKHSGI